MVCFSLIFLLNLAFEEDLDVEILGGGNLLILEASDSNGAVFYSYDEVRHEYCRQTVKEG